MITLAIADDEALFRKGISLLINDLDNMSLYFEAVNGKDLLDKLEKLDSAGVQPDVLLLDLNMPEMNGIEAAKVIREKYPDLKFIVLSSYYSKAFIVNMIELGAAGYLAKNSAPEDMEHTIREVAAKGFFYDQKVMEVIRESMVKKTRPQLRVPFGIDISDREREVLQLICEEYTTPEIAEKLFISPRTVDGHRNNLLQKMDCRNTAGLVVVAIQQGLVDVKKAKF